MAKVYGQTVFEQYLRANRRSKELNDRARSLLPGGITVSYTHLTLPTICSV